MDLLHSGKRSKSKDWELVPDAVLSETCEVSREDSFLFETGTEIAAAAAVTLFSVLCFDEHEIAGAVGVVGEFESEDESELSTRELDENFPFFLRGVSFFLFTANF